VAANDDEAAFAPVFKKCARCGYSLRGLPADHACPECGLRFDRRCALFRVTNPKQLLVCWVMIFSGGWVTVRNLPHLANLAGASASEKVGAFAGVLWVVFVVAGLWYLAGRYRRGLEVAVTGDGLIVRLPGFNDDVIPWSDIGRASIMELPEEKPQIASVFIKSKNKTVQIGGVANVFPKHKDVERFVAEVNDRVDAAGAERSCLPPQADSDGATDPRK